MEEDKKLTPSEVKAYIRAAQADYTNNTNSADTYRIYRNKIRYIRKICPHTHAYTHSTSRDDFEGRLYAKVICHDCGITWEDRVYCGRLEHPETTAPLTSNLRALLLVT